LVPKARRIAVLLNPLVQGTNAADALADFQEAARTLGLEIVHVLRANTTQQIDAAFATLEHERPDALWVAGSGFFASHSAQIVNLAAHSRIPAAYGSRDIVVAGGLMSYAAKVEDSIRQVGVYAGRILKGAKPADLPVVQATTFEFVINLQTARTLGIDVPPGVFAIADELIE
jgi:putative ABC transport system substrate-binding protein